MAYIGNLIMNEPMALLTCRSWMCIGTIHTCGSQLWEDAILSWINSAAKTNVEPILLFNGIQTVMGG